MPIIRDRGDRENSVPKRAGSVEDYDDFLIAAELLQRPRLARIYVYTCYTGPTTIDIIIDALNLKRATTYDDIEKLEEIGAIQRDDSTRPHQITAEAFAYVDPEGIAITPTVLHAVALHEIDDDIAYIHNRYGSGTIAAAVRLVAEYYAGERTKRMVATALGIEPVEGMTLVKALERAIAVGSRQDPYFELVAGDVEPEVETSIDPSLGDRSPETSNNDG
jgi:hypothetical protein